MAKDKKPSSDSESSRQYKTADRVPFRCNLVSLAKQIRTFGIRSDHINSLKKTPFWPLIRAILEHELNIKHCKTKGDDLRTLIKTYNKTHKDFRIGDSVLRMKPLDVKLLFGIVDGEERIQFKRKGLKITYFLQECFPERTRQTRLTNTLIERKIRERITRMDEESLNHVASLITLYILCTFFLSLKNRTLPWVYTAIVADLDVICLYNWSAHILEKLNFSMKESKDTNVERCVMVIPFLLCEKTNILNPVQTEYKFPRLLKWNIAGLSTLLQDETTITEFNLRFTMKDELEMTEEEAEIYQDLRDANDMNIPLSQILERMRGQEQAHGSEEDTDQSDDEDVDEEGHNEEHDEEENDEEDCGHREADYMNVNFIRTSMNMGQQDAPTECTDDQWPEHSSLDELRIQNTEMKIELEKQKTAMETMQAEIEVLQNEKKMLVEEKNDLIVREQEAKREMQEIKEQLDKKNSEIVELLRQIEQYESGTDVVDSSSAEKTAQLAEKEAEITVLKSQITKLNKEISALQKETKTPAASSLVRRVIQRNDRTRKIIDTPDEKDPKRQKKDDKEGAVEKGKTMARGKQAIAKMYKKKAQPAKKKMPFKKGCPAYKYLPAPHKKFIKQIYDKEGLSGSVWAKRENAVEFVNVRRAIDTMEGGKIDTIVIDGWATLIKDRAREQQFSETTTVFNAMSWAYVAQSDLCPAFKDFAVEVIDKRIEEAVETNLLIFPINTTGSGEVGEAQMDHFTLLTFDTATYTWRHYNSMDPEEDEDGDMHYERAKVLIKYVEDRMKDVLRKQGPMAVMDPNFNSKYLSEDFPKQLPYTNDCGVIVCNMMEKLIMQEDAPPLDWATKQNVAEYRAKMIKGLIDDTMSRQ